MLKEIIRSGRAPSRGFTMTEVLAVIGVAGIFLALLIPAISMARQTANLTKCLAKQRQFMQAIMSYASDHDGTLPAPNWGNGAAAPQGWLYNPKALSSDNTNLIGPGYFSEKDVATGVLYPYLTLQQNKNSPVLLKDTEVYHCTANQATYGPDTVQVVTSFIMNGAVCGFANGGKAHDLKSFKGSAIILWEIPGAPSSAASGDINDGANWPTEGETTRHKHGSTIGFLDGHAELMTWQQFTDEWYNHIPGRLWCAPGQSDGGKHTWSDPPPFHNQGWPSSPPPEQPDP